MIREGKPSERYRGWSHEKIIEHQRGKIRDIIRAPSSVSNLKLGEPLEPRVTEKVREYVRRWKEEEIKEEPDNAGSTVPLSSVMGTHGATLNAYGRTSKVCSSTLGGGSTVKVHSTANQKRRAQETLRPISQPEYDFSKPEVKIEWEISNFVWWSEFLKKLPEAYLKLLDWLGIGEDDYYAEYHGFYCYRHTVKNPNCPVGSIYVPVVDCGKYHPYTSVKHRRRASVRALHRLEFLQQECRKRRVKFDYLITIDLTLPKAVSEKWYDSRVECRIRLAVMDFLSELHRELFPKKNSQFGVMKNPHYWATKSPLDPHRHVHLTLPNVCYNKNTDMFHRFHPHIDKDLIKRVWKKCLVKNHLWFGVPENAEPVICTKYIKFANKEQVLHRLSYCARKPIEDMVKYLELSDISENFNVEFAQFLLDYTPRRVNLGFLTNLKRFGYSHKPSPFRCPICGCEMEPEWNKVGDKRLYPRPPPNIRHLFRDKKGDWCETINLVRRW